MPSVFPGMDPFIEADEWEDFHGNMIGGIQAALIPSLRPDYLVRTERRVFVEHPFDDPQLIRPDLSIARPPGRRTGRHTAASATAVLEPVECTLAGPIEVQEKYLVIRKLKSAEVVTVIEVLSPSNKRAGSEGREEYLAKRDEVLQSRTNLVELDLLRGGSRLPTLGPPPSGDYYAFVCRAKRRLRADVYAWPLPHRLPTIPIPLSPGDREASLDLQAVFDSVYDRAGYDYSLDYRQPIQPPLDKATAKWVRGLLKPQQTRS
ncbi:MAG: DUF4058 family protein [Planctomycetaceae bacterium]